MEAREVPAGDARPEVRYVVLAPPTQRVADVAAILRRRGHTVAETTRRDELYAALALLRPHVVLTSHVSSPGAGMPLLQRCTEVYGADVLALLLQRDPAAAEEALRRGASGSVWLDRSRPNLVPVADRLETVGAEAARRWAGREAARTAVVSTLPATSRGALAALCAGQDRDAAAAAGDVCAALGARTPEQAASWAAPHLDREQWRPIAGGSSVDLGAPLLEAVAFAAAGLDMRQTARALGLSYEAVRHRMRAARDAFDVETNSGATAAVAFAGAQLWREEPSSAYDRRAAAAEDARAALEQFRDDRERYDGVARPYAGPSVRAALQRAVEDWSPRRRRIWASLLADTAPPTIADAEGCDLSWVYACQAEALKLLGARSLAEAAAFHAYADRRALRRILGEVAPPHRPLNTLELQLLTDAANGWSEDEELAQRLDLNVRGVQRLQLLVQDALGCGSFAAAISRFSVLHADDRIGPVEPHDRTRAAARSAGVLARHVFLARPEANLGRHRRRKPAGQEFRRTVLTAFAGLSSEERRRWSRMLTSGATTESAAALEGMTPGQFTAALSRSCTMVGLGNFLTACAILASSVPEVLAPLAGEPRAPVPPLDDEQRKFLDWLAAGCSERDAATRLGWDAKDLRVERAALLVTLGVGSLPAALTHHVLLDRAHQPPRPGARLVQQPRGLGAVVGAAQRNGIPHAVSRRRA